MSLPPTNIEFVTQFMNFGSPLNQIFLIEAVDQYAAQAAAMTDEEVAEMEAKTPLISVDAWRRSARQWIEDKKKAYPDQYMYRTHRVIVAVQSCGTGEPDLYFCKVRCSETEFENCDHYERAKQAARDEGYEGVMVPFDEHDKAGKAMLPLFQWETASIWHANHEEVEEEVA